MLLDNFPFVIGSHSKHLVLMEDVAGVYEESLCTDHPRKTQIDAHLCFASETFPPQKYAYTSPQPFVFRSCLTVLYAAREIQKQKVPRAEKEEGHSFASAYSQVCKRLAMFACRWATNEQQDCSGGKFGYGGLSLVLNRLDLLKTSQYCVLFGARGQYDSRVPPGHET